MSSSSCGPQELAVFAKDMQSAAHLISEGDETL
jgi:hypothetical protein